MNNLNVVTKTGDQYATAFSYTEEEVFASMEDLHLYCAEEDAEDDVFSNTKITLL